MERKKLQNLILGATEGLIEYATDMTLYFLYYEAEVINSPNMNTVVSWAPWAAERELEKINYQTIKRAIIQLIDKGLVKKTGGKLELTPEGRSHLKQILPSIGGKSHRNAGEIYLIAYDVSETTRSSRSCLRRLLKKIKAKRIQESLFVVIVDPQQHLEELLSAIPLTGQVLVTKLGSDSILGGKSITDFLIEAYDLVKLNDRYQDFIENFSKIKVGKLTRAMLDFSFNSIVKDDPNLPPEFLPDNWMGKKAWKLYNQLHTSSPMGP